MWNDSNLIPCELKTTRSSANKPPAEHYVEQLAAESALSGNTRGRLYVLYLAGNYRPPTPQMKVYELTFSPEEMENWKAELETRLRLVLKKDATIEWAEFNLKPYHYDWECKNCPAKASGACDGGHGRGTLGFFGPNLDDIIGMLNEE